jgi:two-component system CheB/CheR fusion protein
MSEPEENEKPHRDPELEHVIEKISTEHGFDVRGYKRSTLYRRIRKRISDAGAASPEEYLLRLETNQLEYAQLVNTILINVTEFFRDPEAWQFLQQECLPALIRRRGSGQAIRCWSVGCATGEEAYSLAICLAEALGEHSPRDVKIYATDMDEGALAPARAGVYGPEDMRNVSSERLGRFFEEQPGGRYLIRRELRSSVIFGRHNALVDPPISRQDLLVCRNLLIYFDTETQQQLLPRFHYALRDEGYLFLGKAETLMTRSLLFRPLEPRYRIFQRVPREGATETPQSSLELRRLARETGPSHGQDLQHYTLHTRIEQAIDPLLVLDPAGRS